MMAANQISDTEGGSRASNQLPNQEDVDDLLAQYAPQTDDAVEIPTIVESFKDYNTPISSRESPQPAATAIPSTAMSLAPPRRTTSAGDMSNRAPSESSRHGHDDSISEGEIVEDPPPSMMPPFQPGAHTNLPDTSAGFLRRESIKVLQRRQTRGDSPSHAAPMDSNKANYDMSDQPGPKWRPTGAPVPQERDSRSAHDALGRLPEKRHSNHVESSDQEKSPMPTLSDFLSHNDDLREWLEITNYSNKTYRDRILSTHREIVALEVKRTQLLSGMKVTGLTPPTKIELEVPERVASTPTNKRPFTEMQDPRDEYSNPAHKMSRNNEHWPVYDREARDDGWPRSEGPRGRRRSPASPYQPREPDRSYSPPGYNEPRRDSLDTDHQADRRASYSNIRGTPRGHAHDGVNAGFGRARGAPARADYWNSTRGRRGGP